MKGDVTVSILPKPFLAVAALSLASLAAVGVPQGTSPDPAPPSLFAIRNARIVVAPGDTLQSGTIVLRDGMISAVGENVDVPPGTWVIDGSGLTVYPGLVDALSTLGLPDTLTLGGGRGAAGRGGAPGGDTRQSWGPEDRPATYTWVNAADELEVSEDDFEAWRNAGVTSVVASPERGFFPGQASWINLGDDRAGRLVVGSHVAMRVGSQSGPGHTGYPGALLGVIAYWRQTFMDAAWYDEAWTVYESAPAGLERPAYDRALEPLRTTLATGQPVLFPANRAREIDRALAVAEEAGVQPVIYGAQEAYRMPDALVGIPVLVNVDWPDWDRNSDPEADIPLETLRLWDRAPTTPGELERTGVPLAFYSGDLSASDFLGHVRQAIDLGLSEDAALAALTSTPAEIFGVTDRVGTLEPGKIANLIVTDGDLFDADTKIRHVFVDGRKYDPPGEQEADTDDESEEEPAGPRSETQATPTTPVPITNDRGPLTDSPVTLIRDATVLTITNGTIEDGDVLIRDGKIADIGPDIAAPENALVIDATGQYVMPGIIDAHSHIAADAINEGSVSVSAMVRIRDVLNPDDVAIYRALAGGVTAAHVLHGSANTIGGQNQLIKMRWGADAAGLVFEGAAPTIKFALGENVTRDRQPDRFPATRMGVAAVVRQALLDARDYQREWSEYDAARTADPGAPLIPPRRDLKLDALVEVLNGERWIHAHSYRSDEILELMRAVEEFGVHIGTFQHVLEGYKVADEIAAHGAMASTFSDWWAYKVEAYDAIPYNAALMTERGIVVSINSDDAEEMRHLNQEAAKTMRWGGLTENQALRLITINPAIQVGVDDRAGSIEVGKDADLVIFSDHPLSVYSVVEKTLVDGQVYFDREEDARRRTALEEEKAALLARHRRTGRGGRAGNNASEGNEVVP
jgi:imidazolonepropionase-like amidohydrolase